ncbi:MAG: hypothetical protein H6871_02645 [Methylobacteriaceae bacterium]|nr:hypothetical protein [Methylobacteriaceae bacterium]
MTAIETTTTPAGLQTQARVARRRWIVLALNLAVYGGLAIWLERILSVGGWSFVDVVFFVCFLVAAPWAVLGFVNAALGLWLLRFSRHGLDRAAPFVAAGEVAAPLARNYALIMTIRNEDAARAVGRPIRMEAELSATADTEHFSYHLLSDTSDERYCGRGARDRQLACGAAGRGGACPLSASPRQCRLQGRQCPRILRTLRGRLRGNDRARRRQLHAR